MNQEQTLVCLHTCTCNKVLTELQRKHTGVYKMLYSHVYSIAQGRG